MKIAIGSDKSGFVLKEAVKKYLQSNNYEVEDLGTKSVDEPMPYYVVAPLVAPLVANKTYDRAILICGTGMGMNILANKYQGVYAAACENLYSAKMCRAINDANILCMGGWIIGPEMGVEMVKAFLNTEFLEGLEPFRQEFLSKAAAIVEKLESDIYDK